MKLLNATLAMVLLATFFFACKKETTTGTTGFTGIYQGKWGDITGDPHSFFKLEFKPGGNLIRYNESGQVTATGNWVMNGLEVEASYIHNANNEKHSIKGIYTDFDGEIMGTWGYGNNKANGGTFMLKKQ